LEGNSYSTIPGDLVTSTCLQNLNLADNGVTSLPENLITNLPYLVTLNLQNNELSSFPTSFFVGVDNLSILDVSQNSFTSDSFIEQIPGLEKLDASDNKIGALTKNLTAPSLFALDLSGNSVGILENTWVSGLPTLRYLSCSNCDIATNVKVSDFNEEIISIDLSYNQFTEFPRIYAPSLNKLALGHNLITTDGLARDAFDDLASLKILNLENNLLTTPFARYFRYITELTDLNWDLNPWVCDCASVGFDKLVHDPQVPLEYLAVIKGTVVCVEPVMFQGQLIDSIDPEFIIDALNCNFTTPFPDFTTPTRPPTTPSTTKPSNCPDPCACEDDDKFVNCENRDLDHIPYPLPPQVETLLLGHNKIANITPEAFEGCRKLEYIGLNDNLLTGFSGGEFSTAEHLKGLVLDDNQIKSLNSAAFPISIETIYLKRNQLKSITDGMFNNLPNLQVLSAEANNITEIVDTAFSGCTNLAHLHFAANQLSEIPNFTEIDMLDTLDLSMNEITSFGSYELDTLREFSIYDNEISSVEKVVSNYPNLSVLKMSKNNLQNATLDFAAHKKLTAIALDECSISEVNNLQLPATTKSLWLAANYFTTIPVIDNLYYLNMNLNLLENLNCESYSGNAVTLERLTLSENTLTNDMFQSSNWLTVDNAPNLKSITVKSCQLPSIPEIFSVLPNLESVDLTNNPLMSVGSNDISTAAYLTSLTLDNCDIAAIDPDAFSGLFGLQSLSLNNNELSYPISEWFANLNNLAQVTWDNNPWVCDCHCVDYMDYVDATPALFQVLDQKTLCTDSVFANQFLLSLNSTDVGKQGDCSGSGSLVLSLGMMIIASMLLL